jgi:inorganic triphosphatase YgiF
MRLQDHTEIELKLTAVGDDPGAVLDQVERIERLGPVSFGPPTDHQLHDIYWDLPDSSLRAQHLSIRLRQIDDRLLFTAKGSTSSAEGVFRRNELELPATVENWRELQRIFREEGGHLRTGSLDGGPADWLASAGMEVTQDRATHRTVRLGHIPQRDTPAVEMALDRTQFRFGTLTHKYWEIEIEQTEGQNALGERVLIEIGEELQRLFPGQLERSTMGKYSRGLLIERQLRATGRLVS